MFLVLKGGVALIGLVEQGICDDNQLGRTDKVLAWARLKGEGGLGKTGYQGAEGLSPPPRTVRL